LNASFLCVMASDFCHSVILRANGKKCWYQEVMRSFEVVKRRKTPEGVCFAGTEHSVVIPELPSSMIRICNIKGAISIVTQYKKPA